MKLLSISTVVPYDKIGHAGGKTYNYYMKSLAQDADIDLHITAFSRKSDLGLYDLTDYQIPNTIILSSGDLATNIKRILLDILGRGEEYGSLFSQYKRHCILKALGKMEQQNQLPDVIQLEWTEMVLLAKDIKERYPEIKLIASEHDVSFLGAQRKMQRHPGNKKYAREYALIRRLELEALQLCDVAMPQNEKDKALLVGNGIPEEKIHVLTPFYHDMRHIVRKKPNQDILFWGAMYRPENYEAAIWFIENVIPLLSDLPVRFIVAGNRPPEQLKKYADDRVVITGFVEDETPLFESSMCFVSPLQTGAGIKVKVIEALSAGIPILTNSIGIEGIPAVNGESYFHCEKAEEYAEIIRKIFLKQIDVTPIETSQRLLIKRHFDLKESLKKYINTLELLVTV